MDELNVDGLRDLVFSFAHDLFEHVGIVPPLLLRVYGEQIKAFFFPNQFQSREIRAVLRQVRKELPFDMLYFCCESWTLECGFNDPLPEGSLSEHPESEEIVIIEELIKNGSASLHFAKIFREGEQAFLGPFGLISEQDFCGMLHEMEKPEVLH